VSRFFRKIPDGAPFVPDLLDPRQLAHDLAHGAALKHLFDDSWRIDEPRSVPHGELPILADDSAELHVKVELQLSVPDEPGFDPHAEIRVLEGFAGALAGPANGVVVEGLPRHARLHREKTDFRRPKNSLEDVLHRLGFDRVVRAHMNAHHGVQIMTENRKMSNTSVLCSPSPLSPLPSEEEGKKGVRGSTPTEFSRRFHRFLTLEALI
jgi:hypothetical protein